MKAHEVLIGLVAAAAFALALPACGSDGVDSVPNTPRPSTWETHVDPQTGHSYRCLQVRRTGIWCEVMP